MRLFELNVPVTLEEAEQQLFILLADMDLTLLENLDDYDRLQDALAQFTSTNDKIGEEYIYVSMWTVAPMDLIQIGRFSSPKKLVAIKHSAYVFDHSLQPYPKGTANKGAVNQHSFLFGSKEKYDEFISFLTMSFGTKWRIVEKDLQ